MSGNVRDFRPLMWPAMAVGPVTITAADLFRACIDVIFDSQ
jgi:hypothetical protein